MTRESYKFRGSSDRTKKRRKIAQPYQLEQPKVQHCIIKERELKKKFAICCTSMKSWRKYDQSKQILIKWIDRRYKEEHLLLWDYMKLNKLFSSDNRDFFKDCLKKFNMDQLKAILKLRDFKPDEEYIKDKYKEELIESCFSLLTDTSTCWEKRFIEQENTINTNVGSVDLTIGWTIYGLPIDVFKIILYYIPHKTRLNKIGLVSEIWYSIVLSTFGDKKFKLNVGPVLDRIPYSAKKSIRLLNLVYNDKSTVTNFENQLKLGQFPISKSIFKLSIIDSITWLKFDTNYSEDMKSIQKRWFNKKFICKKLHHLEINTRYGNRFYSPNSSNIEKFVLSDICYPNVKQLTLQRSRITEDNFYIDVERSSAFLKQIECMNLEYHIDTMAYINNNNSSMPTEIFKKTINLEELYINMSRSYTPPIAILRVLKLSKWILKLKKVEINFSNNCYKKDINSQFLSWLIKWGDRIIFYNNTNLRELTIKLQNINMDKYNLVWYRDWYRNHTSSKVKKIFELKNELNIKILKNPTNVNNFNNVWLLMDKMQTDIYFTDCIDINKVYSKLASFNELVIRDAFLNKKSNIKRIRIVVHWPYKNLQKLLKNKLKIVITNKINKYNQYLIKNNIKIHLDVKEHHVKNIVIFVWSKIL